MKIYELRAYSEKEISHLVTGVTQNGLVEPDSSTTIQPMDCLGEVYPEHAEKLALFKG